MCVCVCVCVHACVCGHVFFFECFLDPFESQKSIIYVVIKMYILFIPLVQP